MNEILQKTEDATRQNIKPAQLQPVVEKLVEAGRKIMYSPDTRDMLVDQLSGDGDMAENIGGGIAKLMGILLNQSKGTAPMQALIPAGTILLCEGMQLLEDAGKIKVDLPLFEDCMQAMASNLLQLLGVTPDKIAGMLNGEQAATALGSAPEQPAAPPASGGIIAGATGGM